MLYKKQKTFPASNWIRSQISQGFTLVELIVVVTILAILATIGFVSYSSYLTGVRDTNRLAQLVSISDGLELYSTKNNLPLPDDNVEVQANGTTIAYQGYAGANTLETIDFTKGGKDPRDDQYFTYYLTKDRKYFQLMGFLEESVDISTRNTQNSLNIINSTHAVDYTDRIPSVYGKKLGILTDTTNTPIQEISTVTNLDLLTTSATYTSHFSDNSTVTGSGAILLSSMAARNSFVVPYDSSLVTYFDFDNKKLQDNSVTQIPANLLGDSELKTVKGEDAAYFPYTGGDYIDLGTPTILSSGLTDFSVSIWSKLNVDISSSVATNYHLLGNETYNASGWMARIGHSSPGRIEFRTSTSGSATQVLSNPGDYPNDQKWHHLVFTKEGTLGTIYLDGTEISGYSSRNSMTNPVTTNGFAIGGSRIGYTGQAFSGYLDDVRIYNRAISVAEVTNLYNIEKKID